VLSLQFNHAQLFMTLCIIIVLALCMITTAIAGPKNDISRQAGKSPIYFYDVEATATHGPGQLIVDFDKHTFIFNGKGFKPSQQILLRASAGVVDCVFASGKTTPKGNLHIAGEWKSDNNPTDVFPAEVVNSSVGSGGSFTVFTLKTMGGLYRK
jgi:hypothetical protein